MTDIDEINENFQYRRTSRRFIANEYRLHERQVEIEEKTKKKQYKYLDVHFIKDLSENCCSQSVETCNKRNQCHFPGNNKNFFCACDSCEKKQFPCVVKKFPCKCKLCQRCPDFEAIPKTLSIFFRLDVWMVLAYFAPFYKKTLRTSNAKFNKIILRSEIYGASAVGTHFAQERFSEIHLDKLEIDKNLDRHFEPETGFITNFKGNLKAWKEQKKVEEAINNFKKKYHRYPPCFRERMDIRAITKVSSN